MLLASEALQRILLESHPLPPEELSLTEGAGRILAEDVEAAMDFPPFDNSAMDGYAVRAQDCSGVGPHRLEVIEHLPAGRAASQAVGPGQAIKIMTGAPIPAGADCVVPVEATDGGAQSVEVRGLPESGQYVRRAGEDIRRGQCALEAGQSLHPLSLAYLASLGVARLCVRPAPKVGILTTGDELISVGQPLGPGQVYASNHLSLVGLARGLGARARALGPVPDRLEDVVEAIRELIGWSDVLLSSGGVSMGDYDLVRLALDRMGFEEIFYRVRIKPGKPLVFGRLGKKLVFGLPGNPASSVITFLEFVEPALRKMAGALEPGPPRLMARAEEAFSNKSPLRQYVRVALRQRGAELWASPLPGQGSGLLRSLAGAGGLAILEPATERIAPGDLLSVRPLPSTASFFYGA